MESYVSDPTSLEAVRELDDPPDVVAKIEKGKKQSSGGGACGHSPACIILLPVIVGEMAFPARYQEATITTKGSVTYRGIFKQNGEFIRATTWDGTTQRSLGVVELPSLSKRIIVEVGRAKIGPDGKPGKLVRSSIQSQVDLLSLYEERLNAATAKEHALVEMVGVLGTEAISLATQYLADPKEPAQTKTAFLKSLCSSKVSVIETPADRKALLSAVAKSDLAPDTALAGLSCFSAREDVDDAKRFLSRVAREVCEADENGKAIFGLLDWAGASPGRREPNEEANATRNALQPKLSSCSDERKLFFSWMLGATASSDDLGTLLRHSLFAKRTAMELDAKNDDHYAAIVSSLRNSPAGDRLLRKLPVRPTTSFKELEELVKLYATADTPVVERAYVLSRLALATPRDANLLRQQLTKEHTDAPDKEKHLYPIALSTLGQTDQQILAARNLVRYRTCVVHAGMDGSVKAPPRPSAAKATPARPPRPKRTQDPRCGLLPPLVVKRPAGVYDDRSLASFGLWLAGCSAQDLKAAATLARQKPKSISKPVCSEKPRHRDPD